MKTMASGVCQCFAADADPAEAVGYLTRVFEAFDMICTSHGVEKIKTIGDAYMAVGGLPGARTDHVVAIADTALDMLDAVRGLQFQERPLQVRIGIHSGPAAAGVIGHNVFSYDLWGDTVNLASRLEGLSRFYEALGTALDTIEIDPASLVLSPVGTSQVLALGTERATSAGTGRAYETDSAWLWTLEGGRITGLTAYHDTAAMAAALG